MHVAFVGAGKMATALAAGLGDSTTIAACDIVPEAREAFAAATGGEVFADLDDAVPGADVIVIAVKPAVVPTTLPQIKLAPDEAAVVSIAAGVSLATLEAGLPGRRVLRVMPNTPSLVGQGAAAFARGSRATDDDAAMCRELLAAVGTVDEVPESLLDAVTGLSGSGPAYGFVIIEALADAGVRAGLPRPLVQKLAAQTLAGAAAMVLQTGEHPAALKDAVASPAGTTIAGLAALEAGGLRAALQSAVAAATDRSRQLGQD